jgi:glycosyltransferase involved in cell wall biosynthesis
MSDPLVSVIVPFHNQERYLAEALESILVQNYEPMELLLVDDGSTDGSGSIARRYSPSDRYVHRRNGGAAAARNTGLLAAHGEFVSFCDSDDRWEPEKLALQLRSFAADPELDVSFTGVREFVTPELDPASLPARAPRQIASGVCVSSMLARRQVFSDVGQFDDGLRLGEWADWYARLLESGCKVAIHPEILVHRRLHDRNNTLTHWHDRGEYARVFKKALDRRRDSE